MPAGVFRSDDCGATWTLNPAFDALPERPQWFGGGNDFPVLHSISIDPRDSRPADGGDLLRRRLGDRGCRGELDQPLEGPLGRLSCRRTGAKTQHPGRASPGALPRPSRPSLIQHHNAQFRSSNGAAQWDTISETFGFGVAAHPTDRTAWFVPAQKDEIPHSPGRRVLRAEDDRWRQKLPAASPGPPPKPCYDLVLRHALDVDSTGDRACHRLDHRQSLAERATPGESWRVVTHHLPPVYALRFAAELPWTPAAASAARKPPSRDRWWPAGSWSPG